MRYTHQKYSAFQQVRTKALLLITILLVFVGVSYGQYPEGKWVSTNQKDCKYFYVNFYPKFKSATWTGGCKDGFADGEGKLVIVMKGKYADTIVYTGTMTMGHITGYGELTNSNQYYKGNFVDAKLHGKGFWDWGKSSWGEKSYEGDFVEGRFEGFGIHKEWYGEIYVGEFKSNEREGKGKLIDRDSTVYEGEFHYGQPYGKQVVRFKDGDSVVGQLYKYNSKFNKAVYTYKDGSVFEGELDGTTFRPKNGKVIRKGVHVNDVVDGKKGPVKTQVVASGSGTNSTASYEREDSDFEKEIVRFVNSSKSIVSKCEEFETCLKTKVYFDCQSLKYEIAVAKPQPFLNECNYLIDGLHRRKSSIQIERGIQNYNNVEAELNRIRNLLKGAIDKM